MKFSIKTALLFLFCASSTIGFAQYITVDPTKNAQQLVQDVLINSSCANASNFQAKGDTFTNGQNSYGYFNAGASNFPFAEGIVLSTWSSVKAQGPFVAGNQGGGDKLWKGDSDLEQALGLNKTTNATSLEFDFVALTNFVSFNYIFASNEYQYNFPCDYSDGFAFLIKEKGSTGNYQNLAVLPGTATAVSSKNVRPLVLPFQDSQNVTQPGCPPVNEMYFNGLNTPNSPINYSGQTKVLTAQTNVIAGKTYHIKLVIADDIEEQFDSAVFLQAGSFTSKIDLGPDRSTAENNSICFGDNLVLDSKLPASYFHKWYKNGVEITGENSPSYTVTDSGVYKVVVALTSTCLTEGKIKVGFTPEIIVKNTTLAQCDDDADGITLFDLTKVDAIIKNNDPSLGKVVYYESLADAQNQVNSIANPSVYKNLASNQTAYARVTNATGCEAYANLALTVSNNSIAPQNPIETCDDDAVQDGLYHFDLKSQVDGQVLSGLPSGLLVEYYLSENEAISQKNKLPNIFNTTIPNQQIIYARIVNGADCFRITPETLVVKTFIIPDFQDETVFLCDGDAIDLTVNTGFPSYLWSTGATANTIPVATAGTYTVKVTGANGCERTKTFRVIASGIATITGATITDFSGNENTVLVQYSGLGNYEFSLNGLQFQDNPLFTNVSPDKYLVLVRDKNGCGTSDSYPIYVLDSPRFFTPNGDGINDLWKIKNIEIIPNATISIYDRYGKLLKQLNASSTGWNGTFIGSQLPADDYWYTVKLEDGRETKGHFSLKR